MNELVQTEEPIHPTASSVFHFTALSRSLDRIRVMLEEGKPDRLTSEEGCRPAEDTEDTNSLHYEWG